MATTQDFEDITNSLEGTVSAPHFDRTAFKVKRIYATLGADGLSANLKLLPDEQEYKCMIHAEAFSPVDNAWGKQGWTVCILSVLTKKELRAALEMAWAHAWPKKPIR